MTKEEMPIALLAKIVSKLMSSDVYGKEKSVFLFFVLFCFCCSVECLCRTRASSKGCLLFIVSDCG